MAPSFNAFVGWFDRCFHQIPAGIGLWMDYFFRFHQWCNGLGGTPRLHFDCENSGNRKIKIEFAKFTEYENQMWKENSRER